jgi:exodeoxyribonuclease V alpha subunit
MITSPQEQSTIVDGDVRAIRWRHRDGTVIADVTTEQGTVTVIGPLGEIAEGETITVFGTIVQDPSFGRCVRVRYAIPDPDTAAQRLIGYLASGLIPYVGPATATAIVETFGLETIETIVNDPQRLTVIRGITPERARQIRRAVVETEHLAPIVGLLDPFGVPISICRRIWRAYGESAVDVVLANPWRLAKSIVGVGFKTADAIAIGLGRSIDAPERIEAAALQALRDAAAEGDVVLPRNILATRTAELAGCDLSTAEAAIDRLIASADLVVSDDGLALPALAAAEGVIATKIRAMATFADEPIRVSDAELAAIEAAEGITFDPSQRATIVGALASRVAIITGEPGTGKTTIVRAIIDLAEARGLQTALVSPTGRSAKRLSEATRRPAMTIHRFLRYDPIRGRYEGPTAFPDLLVVDESSMLTSPLAAKLLEPLPPDTRLIFVGDVDQLPPIGPGNLLSDLMATDLVGVFRLRAIHRTPSDSAVPELAHQIRSGRWSLKFDGRTTRFVARSTPEEIAEWIEAFIVRYIDRVDRIQILAPMRRGPAGVDALNRRIQAAINPPNGGPSIRRGGFDLRIGDRILVTANDPEHDLYNGDICYLRGIDDTHLLIERDGELRSIPATAGAGFTLGYAMTVHKAQGSEFPVVIIPIHPSAYLLLERRNLYTAVSRAQRLVVIVGVDWAIRMAIRNHDPLKRRTLLRRYLGGAEPILGPLPDDEDF